MPIQVLITLTVRAFHKDSDGDQYPDWHVGFVFVLGLPEDGTP
jgi:hypothetical protein